MASRVYLQEDEGAARLEVLDAMRSSLIFSTSCDPEILRSLREAGYCVVPINLDEALMASVDELDRALELDPPTSLAEARDTWLSRAAAIADQLALQAASAGEVLDWNEIPERFSEVIVISEKVIPIDLFPCRNGLLGTECVIAHQGAVNASPLDVDSALESEELPLRRIAHVCTYYPGSTSLYEMDVVSSTLRIDNRLAIEHYFYPTEEVASGLFKRPDLDILHFECHGTATTLQVDNPYGVPIDVRALYTGSGPGVFFFLGCRAGQGTDSVAAAFVTKGARGAIGAYCGFLSGGGSDDVSLSAYYDALYQGLIRGRTLGESVLAGRRAAAPGRIYYCAWLLFGNPAIYFSVRQFGGAAPNPRLHRTTGFANRR